MRASLSRTTEARRHGDHFFSVFSVSPWFATVACVCVLVVCGVRLQADLQAQGRAGQAAPPQTAKAIAPIDLTGYGTAVVTEDWHVRMLTPAKDEAEGNACKAYGAPGIMRLPTHLHITWQDENTLKIEADYGTQTRLLYFAPPVTQGRLD